MTKKEFEQLRRDANHLLACIDLVETEGPLRWAANLRTVSRVASSISTTAKSYEKRERQADPLEPFVRAKLVKE